MIMRPIALRDALMPVIGLSAPRTPPSSTAKRCAAPWLRVDNSILKLDSAFDATARLMNNPQSSAVRGVVEQMKASTDLTVQTMFLRGE